jgi:dihydroorotase
MKRREFLQVGLASLPLLANAPSTALAHAAQAQERKYELLLKGGRVIDPSQSMNMSADVAVAGGRIAAIAPQIEPKEALRTVPVTGQLVTPGLVDIHVHGFEGISHWGLNLDPYCIARGVTTAVDAGTSGSDSFAGFRRQVIESSRTRLFAFLNISRVGLVGEPGELIDTRMIDADSALRVAKAHEAVIVGIKVRCGKDLTGPNDVEAVRTARRVAGQIGKPVMMHVGEPYTPVEKLVEELRAGDIVTHSFRAPGTGGVIAADGHVSDGIRKAANRGVLFDIGHGSGGFVFASMETALKEGLPPATISTDLHFHSAHGPVFDMTTTMSKFLLLGLSVEKIVELTTVAAARAINKADELGSLKPGRRADISVLELVQGDFSLVDSQRQVRKATQKLISVMTFKDGKLP